MVALNLPSKLIMLSTAATSSLLCFTTSSTEALNLGKMFGSPIARSPRRVAHAHAHGHGAIYAEKKWGGRFSGLWINDGYYVDNLIVVKCHDPRLPGKYWFLQRDSKKDTLYKIHPNHKNIGLRANSYAEHALRYQPQNVELRLDQVQFQEQTPGVFVVIEQAVVHHHVHSPVHAFVHSPVHGVIHGHHGHAFVHSPGHVVQHHIASPGHVLIHQPVVRPPHHVFPGTPILSPQHIHHHVKIDVVVKFVPEYHTGIGKWVCKCTNTDATDGKAIEVGVLYKYNVLYKHARYENQKCVRLLKRWDEKHVLHLPYHYLVTELYTEFKIRIPRPSKIQIDVPVEVVPPRTPTTATPSSAVVSPFAGSDFSVGSDTPIMADMGVGPASFKPEMVDAGVGPGSFKLKPEMVDASVGTESKKPKKADASVGTESKKPEKVEDAPVVVPGGGDEPPVFTFFGPDVRPTGSDDGEDDSLAGSDGKSDGDLVINDITDIPELETLVPADDDPETPAHGKVEAPKIPVEKPPTPIKEAEQLPDKIDPFRPAAFPARPEGIPMPKESMTLAEKERFERIMAERRAAA